MKIALARMISFILRIYYKIRYGSKVRFGERVIINHRFKFSGRGRILIENEANLWAFEEKNRFFTYSKNAVIKIGAKTRLNGASIHARESVKIGKSCTIGSAIIMDNDFHSLRFEERNDRAKIPVKEVIIGDKVWLGGQCVVLKGVNLGNESVVGFRAVVSKDVPEKTVVAGNPAEVVKKID